MNEIFETLEQWRAQREAVALATVVNVDGSAPRGEGAKMLIAASGKIAGSVSGGCVEGAVAEEARNVLRSGLPTTVRYGINRNMMWDVGLSCGGAIDVFIEPLFDPGDSGAQARPLQMAARPLQVWAEWERAHKRFAICTVIRGPDRVGAKLAVDAIGNVEGGTGDADLDRTIARAASPEIERGQPRRLTVGDYDVFVDVQVPAQRLIIVGAVHVAVALCDFASKAGFSVVIVDPRPQLNSRERFPSAHALQIGWPEDELPTLLPDESTYIAVLTHDEKFDDPSLTLALRSRAKYIGAIGSKKTQALRRERLIAAGFTATDVDRVRAPIGLDLGAQSPEEIAIAILAEMIATKFGHRGSPLKELQAAQIH